MAGEFRVTGRLVLFTLIGFFLVVLTANMIFLNLAVRTFPGEKEEKSYLQGLNYNERLAARAAQEALGWTASIEEARLDGAQARIEIALESASGRPLYGLGVSAVLSRPADDESDRALVFAPLGDGRYAAAAPAGPGLWNLDARALGERGEEFQFQARLVLE